MQSLEWYAYRLKMMSPGEIIWRMWSALGDATRRTLFAVGKQPTTTTDDISQGKSNFDPPGFRLCDPAMINWTMAKPNQPEYHWFRRLLSQADRIMEHKLSFFDLENCDLGSPIDWNRDYKTGKKSPMRFSPSIDYRDFTVTGDAKYVWELNRHHQFVVLARAWRVSGDIRFARAVIEQLESWMDASPFGMGMNWRSPLELGIRLINWVWAIDLIRDSGVISKGFRRKLCNSVKLHLEEITRRYSRGSSSNNHLIGEAAGVYIASSYFCGLKQATHWRQESRDILCREILSQTTPDGINVEQAIGYHLFVLWFFVLVEYVSRLIGENLPRSFRARLEKMIEFVGVLSQGGSPFPHFGDGDDGYVLDLGSRYDDIQSLLAIGAVIFDRSDFKSWAGGFTEPALWLTGQAGRQRFDAIQNSSNRQIHSRAFPYSGMYLLQYGSEDSKDRISMTIDCGQQGMPPLAGHGHADALSFTLRAFGVNVFVDPGTYDYFSYPSWRSYFKSTRAHNTIEIDGKDQAVMRGSFMWNPQANAFCVEWSPCYDGGTVVGEHDGYRRLSDPVIHRRALTLDGKNRSVIIHDILKCKKKHYILMAFHLAENCRIVTQQINRFEIDTGSGQVYLTIDPRLNVDLYYGSSNPIAGWVSRGYHQKVKSVTLYAKAVIIGTTDFVCHLEIGEPGDLAR